VALTLVTATVVTTVVTSLAQGDRQLAAPGRLAVFYGIPALVNGANGDVDRAAAVFAAYDVVVFGAGLESGGSESTRTRAVVQRTIARRPGIRLFGYLALGDRAVSGERVAAAAKQWRALGVQGIFLDEAGFDFGVTRERQHEAIDAVHRQGLRVFVNAFRPEDVLANGSRLQRGDLVLLESFAVRLGQPESADLWFERARTAARFKDSLGVEVWTVTTPAKAFDPALCRMAWWGTVLWGFDGFGWGEPDYAAPKSELPARDCAGATPASLSSFGAYTSEVARRGSRFTRRAAAGSVEVEVDFGSRTGRLLRHGATRRSPGIP
jgi:hypothetical protein